MPKSNKKLTVNLTAPDLEPGADKVMSKNGAVAKIISKPSGPGLLDLPPEIRLMIFRHLLVRPYAIDQTNWGYAPRLDILKTSKLIHKEAFDVFYKENSFLSCLWDSPSKITRSPRVADTIQSIQTTINLQLRQFRGLYPDLRELMNVMQHLGNSSITRGSLVVKILLGTPCLLKEFVRALDSGGNGSEDEIDNVNGRGDEEEENRYGDGDHEDHEDEDN
ncbi:hypothetical protein MMC22_006322 [Lobaria immixta]|nr:hypothetical protein [Lobaria immixta]